MMDMFTLGLLVDMCVDVCLSVCLLVCVWGGVGGGVLTQNEACLHPHSDGSS